MSKPNYQVIDLTEIKVNPDNPRMTTPKRLAKLAKSIKAFPEMLELRPIVVNKDMTILGGNMRYQAAKKAGLKKVPIIIADNLSEEQQQEFMLKDNAAIGEWNFDKLKVAFDLIKLDEWMIPMPDFAIEAPETFEPEPEEPSIPNNPIVNETTETEELQHGEDEGEDDELDDSYEEPEYHKKVTITVFNEDEFDKLRVFLNGYSYAYTVSA